MSNGTFTVIQAKREGRDALIVVDTAYDADELAEAYPWLITVVLPIRAPNKAGLCDDAESQRLSDVEDRLLSVVSEDAFVYAGRITWNGRREVLIYVSDPDDVDTRIRAEAAKMNQPVELETEHEPDWSTYRQFVG